MKKINTVILIPHQRHLDPRVNWLLNNFNDEHNVTAISVNYRSHTFVEYVIDGNVFHIIVNPLFINKEDVNLPPLSEITSDSPYYNFLYLQNILSKKNSELKSEFDFESKTVIRRFRWYCQHFLNLARVFIFTAKILGNISQVIAIDIFSVLAGSIITQQQQAFLVFDAHEFDPYSDVTFTEPEIKFWLNFNRSIIKFVDLPVTVNDLLTAEMSISYSKQFISVPNAECKNQLTEIIPRYKRSKSADNCIFLYQGGFAPGRGLEQLITNWSNTHANCHLYLRGLDNDFTELLRTRAKDIGLLDKRIFFVKAVSEDELVNAASSADVGIIPYDPRASINYKLCCPNKLSQYMAAGLPIIANQLPYVSKIINTAKAGFAIDFDDQQLFVKTIHQLAESSVLRHELGQNAYEYFCKDFNWEMVSKEMYHTLAQVKRVDYCQPDELINRIEHLKIVYLSKSKYMRFKLLLTKIFNLINKRLSLVHRERLAKFIKSIIHMN